jgi:uroporphyrinogen-III synthase
MDKRTSATATSLHGTKRDRKSRRGLRSYGAEFERHDHYHTKPQHGGVEHAEWELRHHYQQMRRLQCEQTVARGHADKE